MRGARGLTRPRDDKALSKKPALYSKLCLMDRACDMHKSSSHAQLKSGSFHVATLYVLRHATVTEACELKKEAKAGAE